MNWRQSTWLALAIVPSLFLAAFFFWPVLALLARGFFPERVLDLSVAGAVLSTARTWRLLGHTLGQAIVGTVGALALGLPGAYLLYRVRLPGRELLRGLTAVPFVLPTVVVGVAFRTTLRSTAWLAAWDGTFAAVALALVFFNFSVVVRTVGGLWQRLDPRAAQVARSLGASRLRAFWTVTLPGLRPAIVSAATVVFLFCATAFGVVMVLGGAGYGTLETEIYQRTTMFLDLPTAAVLSILQFAVLGAALAGSRWLRGPTRSGAVLEGESAATRRTSIRDPVQVGLALVFGLTVAALVGAPLVTLVIRSLQDGSGAWTLANYRALGTTGARHALSVTVWQALGQSLRTATLAATLALTLGALLALALSRRQPKGAHRRVLGALDAVVMLPLGISAVTVGFGLLITWDRPVGGVDLRTSGWLIPVAQAVVALPLVVRTILPVLRTIDPRQRQAAAVLGAAPLRVVSTVDFAVAARVFGLALGFAFAVSLGEFGATAFLARPDAPTLPVVVFQLLSRPGAGNYGMALAAAVLLGLLTAAVMLAAEWLFGTLGDSATVRRERRAAR